MAVIAELSARSSPEEATVPRWPSLSSFNRENMYRDMNDSLVYNTQTGTRLSVNFNYLIFAALFDVNYYVQNIGIINGN